MSWLPALPVLVLALLAATPAVADDAGLAVMRQLEAALFSPGEEMTVRMTLQRPGAGAETRSFHLWTRSAEGGLSQTLIRFDQPASIRDTALLTVHRKGGGQDNWLYVPALQQVRRIAPSDRSESFVQSDFTIEDLSVGIDPEGRDYRVLGEVQFAGRTCIQVEDRPKTDAAARASGYGRVVLYVDKQHHVVHRVDFYDKQDGLLKVLRAEAMVQVGALWRFDKASIVNVQTGSSTVMQVVSRAQVGQVTDAQFSPAGLGRR